MSNDYGQMYDLLLVHVNNCPHNIVTLSPKNSNTMNEKLKGSSAREGYERGDRFVGGTVGSYVYHLQYVRIISTIYDVDLQHIQVR